MGMSIDEHIGVIEDLKSTMSVCMPEPEKTEICASLSEAIDTLRKYQQIEQIVKEWENSGLLCNQLYDLIKGVLEDGNVD
jgi:hypothetical protein